MKKQAQRVSSFVLVLMIVFLCFGTSINVSASQLNTVSSKGTSTNWVWPTSNHTLNSDWPNYSSGKYHGGTDFPVALDTPVYSSCDGEVVLVKSLTTSYGKHIKIKAVVNGEIVYIRYCHLNSFTVNEGDKVSAGQLIAYSGSTGNSSGPHLHYEVRNSNDTYGSSSSPNLNPKNYLPGTSYSFQTNNDPNPPTDLSISINKNAFAVGEEVKFTFHSNNATEQYIPIDVNGVRRHFINVTGMTEYTTSFTETGIYYFCLYTKNSAGDPSTEFYPFTVYDSKPTNLNIYLDKKAYKVGEDVTFHFNSTNAVEQFIPIDINGVRRQFNDVSNRTEYTASFSETGTYGYFLYTKNAYGDEGTEYKEFTVYDSKPTDLNISIDKDVYKVGEDVTFRFNSKNAVEQHLPIDINGVRRDFIDISNKTDFTTSFSEPGVYGYYLHSTNLAGEESSEYKEFVVINPITFSDDFGALIINTAYWKPMYYQGNNQPVYIQHEDVEEYDHTLWHFVKNSDDSYSIRSYLDGSYLTPESFSGENGARIITAQSSDTSWYVVELGDGGRFLMPKNYSKVVDLSNNDGTDGNGFQMYKINFTDAQKYNIYFVEEERDALDYQISADKSSIKTNESSKITISGSVPYVYNYKLHIVDPSGKENVIDNKCSKTYTFKPSTYGTYHIFAEVTSPIGKQIGSTDQRCVTVNVSCSHDYATQVIEPTYTEKGYTLHTCSICGDSFKDNYTDVKEHEYELSGWTWNGTSSATANFTCKDDNSQNKTVNATVTSKTTNATCETAGKTVYTATAKFNGKTYTDKKEVPISATGHSYKLTGWTWSGYESATATFTCENDSVHKKTIDAEITRDTSEGSKIVYTAAVTFEGKEYSDIKTELITHNDSDVLITSDTDTGKDQSSEVGELSDTEKESDTNDNSESDEDLHDDSDTEQDSDESVDTESNTDSDSDITSDLDSESDSDNYSNSDNDSNQVIPGDINGDGKVNMKDVTRLHQYINGWDVFVNEKTLDINGDGKINMKDLTRLHQYVNGWNVEIN